MRLQKLWIALSLVIGNFCGNCTKYSKIPPHENDTERLQVLYLDSNTTSTVTETSWNASTLELMELDDIGSNSTGTYLLNETTPTGTGQEVDLYTSTLETNCEENETAVFSEEPITLNITDAEGISTSYPSSNGNYTCECSCPICDTSTWSQQPLTSTENSTGPYYEIVTEDDYYTNYSTMPTSTSDLSSKAPEQNYSSFIQELRNDFGAVQGALTEKYRDAEKKLVRLEQTFQRVGERFGRDCLNKLLCNVGANSNGYGSFGDQAAKFFVNVYPLLKKNLKDSTLQEFEDAYQRGVDQNSKVCSTSFPDCAKTSVDLQEIATSN